MFISTYLVSTIYIQQFSVLILLSILHMTQNNLHYTTNILRKKYSRCPPPLPLPLGVVTCGAGL